MLLFFLYGADLRISQKIRKNFWEILNILTYKKMEGRNDNMMCDKNDKIALSRSEYDFSLEHLLFRESLCRKFLCAGAGGDLVPLFDEDIADLSAAGLDPNGGQGGKRLE